MNILAYILSAVIFAIAGTLSSTLFRAIFSALINPFKFSMMFQFTGELAGGLGGLFFSLFAFDWLSQEPNGFVLSVICIIVWFATNLAIHPDHHPTAQRLGAILGIVAAVIFLF